MPAAHAQSLLDRAKKAVKKTSVGKTVDASALEVEMLEADFVDLENAGLGVVQVGQLTFGVSGVNIRNGKGVRLHAYLYNPSPQDATIPAPDADLFRLVDGRGRTLDLLSGPKIDGLDGSSQMTVPGLERVDLQMLFGGAPSESSTATLKIGSVGVIEDIPVHTDAAAQIASGGGNSVWSGNQPAQAASPWQTQQPQRPPQNYTPPPQRYTPPPNQQYTPPPTPYPQQGQGNQIPQANVQTPPMGAVAGSNGIQFTISGGLSAQSADSGTVQCSSSPDGRFLVRSSGMQWTIEASAQARDLGSYPASVNVSSLQRSAQGQGTLVLKAIDSLPGGGSLLRGAISGQQMASAQGPVALSADFSCQL